MDEECSSSTTADKDQNIQWMYEGQKGMVNREDYLLGKKIDRNFELYSDVVVKDKDDEDRDDFFRKSLLQPGSTNSASSAVHRQQHVSALDTRVVRTEDPLVALKFQEEQRKRQLLENPLLKLRAQRVLRKEFEKELKKELKKEAKKKAKKRRTISSSDDKESAEARRERRRDEKRSGEVSRSSSTTTRRRRGSNRSSRERRRSRSSSTNRRKRTHHHQRRKSRSRSKEEKEAAPRHKTTDSPSGLDSSSSTATTIKKKLTADELEQRRRAMMDNASWRDQMRERNLHEATEKLRKEQEEMATAKGPNFIRPMMASATEGSSIEKRMQSNRMNIQRQHDHMDKSFVRK